MRPAHTSVIPSQMPPFREPTGSQSQAAEGRLAGQNQRLGPLGYLLTRVVPPARLTLADVGVPDVPLWMLVVKGLALLAVAPGRVMEAVVTNPPAHVGRGHKGGRVEVAPVRVLVAVTLCTQARGQRTAKGAELAGRGGGQTHFCRRWCCAPRLVSRGGRGRSPGTAHSSDLWCCGCTCSGRGPAHTDGAGHDCCLWPLGPTRRRA